MAAPQLEQHVGRALAKLGKVYVGRHVKQAVLAQSVLDRP